jgi:hypothetical protein
VNAISKPNRAKTAPSMVQASALTLRLLGATLDTSTAANFQKNLHADEKQPGVK